MVLGRVFAKLTVPVLEDLFKQLIEALITTFIRKNLLFTCKKLGYQNDLSIMGDRNIYSKIDHDATFMRMSMKENHMLNGQLKPGYNFQIAMASEYLVHVGIFPSPSDTKTLIPFLENFKRIHKCLPEKIVADTRYYNEKNLHWLHAMTDQSIIKPKLYEVAKTRKYKHDIGRAENMDYCAQTDTFTCKAGKQLHYVYSSNKRIDGFVNTYRVYRCDECNGCEYRRECQRCTKDKLPNSGKQYA